MAKEKYRYVSTAFWDDGWIQTLDPSEKLLYLYLLTNPLTNIAGIYKITIRRMCFDTGFNADTVTHILKKFETAKKVFTFDDWVILPNWPKHQKIGERDNNRKGIDSILENLPDEVFQFIVEHGYGYKYLQDLERYKKGAYKGLDSSSNYINLNLNLNSNSNLNNIEAHSGILANPREPSPLDQGDSEAPQASPPALKTKTIVKTKNEADPLYQAIFQSFISKTGAFTNYPKEAQGIKRIIKYCQQHAPKYTNGDLIKLAELVITKYFELTRNGDRFWRGQPFTPSNLSAPGIFDRVLIEIKPINEEVVENVIPF